jgi:hypothetical protein
VYPRVKLPGREGDQSPPSDAKVRKTWTYTSIPPYVFMAQCLVKHRSISIPPYVFMAQCLGKHRSISTPPYVFMAQCLVKHRCIHPVLHTCS